MKPTRQTWAALATFRLPLTSLAWQKPSLFLISHPADSCSWRPGWISVHSGTGHQNCEGWTSVHFLQNRSQCWCLVKEFKTILLVTYKVGCSEGTGSGHVHSQSSSTSEYTVLTVENSRILCSVTSAGKTVKYSELWTCGFLLVYQIRSYRTNRFPIFLTSVFVPDVKINGLVLFSKENVFLLHC